MDAESPRLTYAGTGAQAYADAVATYLGLVRWSSKADRLELHYCSWRNECRGNPRHVFSPSASNECGILRKLNPFSTAMRKLDHGALSVELGSAESTLSSQSPWIVPSLAISDTARTPQGETRLVRMVPIIATDPPYYDNIVPYADISDFLLCLAAPHVT